MKTLLLSMLLLTVVSCGLFEKAKKPVVKKASEIAKELSVKHLGCNSGDAVYEDVEKEMSKFLRVKSSDLSVSKSFAGNLCLLAVGPVINKLVDIGNNALPESWIDDGCSLDGFSGDGEDLAKKLCGKL